MKYSLKNELTTKFFIAAFAYSSIGCTHGNTAELSGYILNANGDSSTKKCIALLREESEGLSEFNSPSNTYTDEKGFFIFTNIVKGSYILSVLPDMTVKGQQPRYEPSVIDLSSEGITNVIIYPTQASTFKLCGKLITTDTDKPISAQISLVPLAPGKAGIDILLNPDLFKKVNTDELGRFCKSHLSQGKYSLTIKYELLQHLSNGQLSFEIEIQPGGDVIVEKYGKVILKNNNLSLRFLAREVSPK